MWRHPNYYKNLRKNLTNQEKYDKEKHDEKIYTLAEEHYKEKKNLGNYE